MGCNNGAPCGAVIPTTWRTRVFLEITFAFYGFNFFYRWFVRGKFILHGILYFFLHRSIFVERACGGMLGVRAYETNYF